MRVVGFGTYDVRTHPRVGIVLEGLRHHDVEVVELNRPLGFSTAERVEMLAKPWLAYRLALRLARCWVSLALASVRARRGGIDAVVVGYLAHFDVILARLLFPRTTIVADLMIFAADTAGDRGVGGGGAKQRLLRALDTLACRCADIVLVDTEEHLALIPPGQAAKGLVVPVGAPEAWFAPPISVPDSEPGGPLRVVFYGLYTPLQGATTIGTALAGLAGRDDVTFTMIGTGQHHDATRELAAGNPQVTWLDWVESGALPALVASHDVCLGIFGTTPKALRVTPNKVYQGAAAGCVVVTSDTAPQRRSLGDAALLVPPGDADALAGALADLADDRARVAALRSAARTRAEAAFAPAVVAEPLVGRLRSAR